MKTYCLVYQGGIANVFQIFPDTNTKPRRILQGDFRTCETFCRGLREMGAEVVPAWANVAGDVVNAHWNFDTGFSLAPFSKEFAKDFVTEEMQ